MQVGNFEKKVAKLYGIGVQVATADDSELADNSITLAKAGKEVETLYDVVLVSPGKSKLGVMKAICDAIGVDLSEGRQFAENLPATLKEKVIF